MTGLHSDPAQQALASLWTDPFLGGLAQTNNAGVPARSNVQYLGVSGHTDAASGAGGLAATGVGTVLPVPAVPGDVISAISIPIGTTAASTPTHSGAAIYAASGAPAAAVRLGTSGDQGTLAIAASALATWTLTTPVTITQANAPYGFIYVLITITASTIPSAHTAPVVSAYAWTANMPPWFSASAGSALGGVPPTPIGTCTAKTGAPYVILT